MKKSVFSAFQSVRMKIRRGYRMRRYCKAGWIYHEHSDEIVVSKREFSIQLENFECQDNLISLLYYGKNHPNYELLLMLVSQKFELLGSLVFPVDKRRAAKPPVKTYVLTLFRSSYETPDEVKAELSFLCGEVPEETVSRVFQKLLFVVGTCCPCMADRTELWRSDTYRGFLEYAVEHDDFPFFELTSAKNVMEAMLRGLPARGNKRSYILDLVPDELRETIIHGRWEYSIRR